MNNLLTDDLIELEVLLDSLTPEAGRDFNALIQANPNVFELSVAIENELNRRRRQELLK